MQMPAHQTRTPHTQREPQHEPLEYSLCWVCVGYVDFTLFVSHLFPLSTQANTVSGEIRTSITNYHFN